MSDVRRYQPVGRGEAVPDKYGNYCKYEDVEHWIGMYNLCNEREQSLLAERDRLREALRWYERHVRDCNRKGKDGDEARNALAQDRGERARAALQEAGDE